MWCPCSDVLESSSLDSLGVLVSLYTTLSQREPNNIELMSAYPAMMASPMPFGGAPYPGVAYTQFQPTYVNGSFTAVPVQGYVMQPDLYGHPMPQQPSVIIVQQPVYPQQRAYADDGAAEACSLAACCAILCCCCMSDPY